MASPDVSSDNGVAHNGNSSGGKPSTRVVIVGAGPAGLLAAILLLRRNLVETASREYRVTLVDAGVDYGELEEHELKKFRSWMIGLSAHGLSSVREVPGLFENYIEKLGVQIGSATFGAGKLKFTITLSEKEKAKLESFTVDRNYICAALARYLHDHYTTSTGNKETANRTTTVNQCFVSYYNTRALYVDAEEKKLLVRPQKTSDGYGSGVSLLLSQDLPVPGGGFVGSTVPIDYDILLGCDGVRSIVRNAFIANHRDFEFQLHDNFGIFKSIHITQPKSYPDGHFSLVDSCMPNVGCVVLPEKDGCINLAYGHRYDKSWDAALDSNDPAEVAAYLKKNFTLFEMDDYEDAGKKWVEQKLATTSMAYCSFYHSNKLQALLMGDAAHATVPNIGQGMNTALADASALNKILDECDDDWRKVLAEFSKERVKEGHALTALSFHTFSLSPRMQIEIVLRQNIHRILRKLFPWFVDVEPMGAIGEGMKLSEAYNRCMKLGYLQRSRALNEKIQRSHFERTTGMVTTSDSMFWFRAAAACAVLAAGSAWLLSVQEWWK